MGAVLDILRGKVGPHSQLDVTLGKRAMTKPAAYPGGRGRQALYLDPSVTGYSASAVAYRCVAYISSNLASVDLVVITGDEANPDHEIAVLWNRRPNPVISARAMKELVFARLELTGEQMIYLDRGPTGAGPITAAWPIYDPVEVVVDQRLAGELQGYVVRVRGGARVPLLPSEVLWLRYPDPFDPWGALAPWKAALYATESDAYARAWQRGEFQHGARPSHVVYLGDLEEEAHDAAVAEFRSHVEGAENAGKSLLVSGPTPVKAERLTLSPAEMSYLESRVANAEEVMLAFGLRADLLAGQATYENQRASKVAAWSDVLLPKLEVVASESDRQLLPDLAQTAAFDVSEVDALRENADALWGRVVSAMTPDLLTIDEGRADIGLDPLPERKGEVTLSEYRARLALVLGAGLPTAGRISQTAEALPNIWLMAPELATEPARAALTGPAGWPLTGRGPRLVVGAKGLRVLPQRTTQVVERAKHKGRTHDQVQKFYDRHERVGQRAVVKLAKAQERVVIRRLRDLVRTSPDVWQGWAAAADEATVYASPWSQLPVTDTRVAAEQLLDGEYWRERTQEYLDAFMAGVWEGGALDMSAQLGLSLDQFDLQVLAAMRTRAEVLAGQVTRTTQQILDQQLLAAGVEGGESIPQLVDRIKGVYVDLAGYRAEAIARTETVGGFNGASRVAAVSSGMVRGRTWLATTDSRTRESHNAMNGETINGLAGPYSNGLMHPGDPTAPPRETVNCRCVETYDLGD